MRLKRQNFNFSGVMILNQFGHLVCVCKTNENFFPLQPSLRYQKDERTLKKCFKAAELKESNECNGTSVDVTKDGALTCTSESVVTGFSAFPGDGYTCHEGFTYRFGVCNRIRG